MLKYVIIVVVVLVVVHGLLLFLGGPVRYRKSVGDDLSKFFKALLFSVYETTFLVIEAPNKKRFLQFQTYRIDEKLGIRFDFPYAAWSEPYHGLLKNVLDERGIAYETTQDENSVSCTTVDLEQDWVRAMEFANMVLLEVFKLRPEDTIKVYLTKI